MWRKILVTLILAAVWGFAGPVTAEDDYPSHPLTMIVPFPPGGSTDTIARIVAAGMRKSLGQPVVIDNVGGAAGSIGVGKLVRAPRDGYTFGIGNLTTHVINGAVYALPYDLQTDFQPLSLLERHWLMIVTRKNMPANDLKTLLAWLKSNPGKALVGTGGAGGISHLAGVLLEKQTHTRLQFVPYRGMGPAMQDLMTGQIDMIIDLATAALPQVKAGTTKAYAVTAEVRLAAAPNVPTVDEAGLPGFYVSAWHGLWAPKGVPQKAIDILKSAIADALADPSTRARLADVGAEVFPPEQQTPEALALLQKADIEKWWPIIKAAGIKPD